MIVPLAIARLLEHRGLVATERVMGMILTVLAIRLILSSLEQ